MLNTVGLIIVAILANKLYDLIIKVERKDDPKKPSDYDFGEVEYDYSDPFFDGCHYNDIGNKDN